MNAIEIYVIVDNAGEAVALRNFLYEVTCTFPMGHPSDMSGGSAGNPHANFNLFYKGKPLPP